MKSVLFSLFLGMVACSSLTRSNSSIIDDAPVTQQPPDSPGSNPPPVDAGVPDSPPPPPDGPGSGSGSGSGSGCEQSCRCDSDCGYGKACVDGTCQTKCDCDQDCDRLEPGSRCYGGHCQGDD